MAQMPAVSVGNYKGVMLCNRPFAAVAGAAAPSVELAAKPSFVTGSVSEKFASVPILAADAKAKSGPSKDTALHRHKTWLKDLQSTKEALEARYLDDVEGKEERSKRFMAREAKMRALMRAAKAQAQAKAEGADDEAQDKAGGSRAAAALPMWAMTEADAEAEVDAREDDEANELLDFARGLDFDKYMDDVEISSMIDQVRDRIKVLEGEEKAAAKADAPAGPGGGKALVTRLPLASLSSAVNDAGDEADDTYDVASNAAEKLLQEDGRAAQVHSSRSLAAVASRSKAAVQAAMDAIHEEPSHGPGPLVVRHTDDNGARLEAKNHVSNLPYMHRNPAV